MNQPKALWGGIRRLNPEPPSPRAIGATEKRISWAVIALLGVILAAVFIKQSRYDEAIWHPIVAVQKPAAKMPSGQGVKSLIPVPAGLSPLGPVETFGPENLSDKIDGKAELYLPSGFIRLNCQRFGPAAGPWWFEVFFYEMKGPREAFSVFSAQRRSGGTPLDLAQFAYQTANSLFFVRNATYIEMVGSEASAVLMKSMVDYARTIAGAGKNASVGEMNLFPADGLVADSVVMLAADAFGVSGLKDVFIATYRVNGKALTAFIAKRSDAAAAAKLKTDYVQFLKENGAKDMPPQGAINGITVLSVFDLFEVVFVQGPCFAGVHEAQDREAALAFAQRFQSHLRKSLP
jgi:hypothetical protein